MFAGRSDLPGRVNNVAPDYGGEFIVLTDYLEAVVGCPFNQFLKAQ